MEFLGHKTLEEWNNRSEYTPNDDNLFTVLMMRLVRNGLQHLNIYMVLDPTTLPSGQMCLCLTKWRHFSNSVLKG